MIVPVLSKDGNLCGCINTFNNLYISCEDCSTRNSDCISCFQEAFARIYDALPEVPVLETDLVHFNEEN